MSMPVGRPGPTGRGTNVKGTGYQSYQIPQMRPEAMELFGRLFGQVGPDSYLAKLASGDQSQFEQLEAPALKQFAGLQGNIASRFSGMGSGARRSSGFANTMTGASSDFAQQLQAQRMGLQRQAQQDLFSMSNMLMSQRPYETAFAPKKKKWWQEFLLGINERGNQLAENAPKYASMA